MKTLVLEKPGCLRLHDTPRPPDAGPGEVMAWVRRVGVCGTDIHAYRGNQPYFSYPRILGHELAVEIAAVGEGVDALAPGDRCAVEPYLFCGDCPPCREGRTNCCASLEVLGVQTDGGMREQIVLPASTCHRSESLSLDTLALVETLGIGKHAVDRAGLGSGDTVAVVGLGPIGLTVVAFALLRGARVVGVDVSTPRCEAAQRLHPKLETLRLPADATAAEVWAQRLGEGPRVVLDATGHRGSMEGSFALPRPGGTLVLVGLVTGNLCFDDPAFHRRELTLRASRNATGADFREIIGHLEAGRLSVEPWITHRAEARRVPEALEGWLAPDAGLLKAVISF